MDLSAQQILKHTYVFDSETGLVTITIRDESDVSLGTIIIERSRHRAFMEAMQEAARLYSPDLESDSFQGHSTRLNKNQFNATTEFG